MPSILVPLDTGDCPYRRRNWEWLSHHYAEHHPGWPIHVGYSGQPWSKGTAVQAAFDQSDDGVIVIADADCIVPPEALERAAAIVAEGRYRWVVPHRLVKRLSIEDTELVLAGAQPRLRRLDRPMYGGIAGGGIVALDRDAYKTVGGIDPRFTGWGGEDFAFGWCLMNLVGPHERLRNDLWHLWHPKQQDGRQPASADIWARYKQNRDNPAGLRALIDERRCSDDRDPAPDAALHHPLEDGRRVAG